MNVLNFDKISKGDMFIFEIKDDIGINFDSLNVRIGSKNYKKDQMNINGDIFQINISDYADGTYTYEISVNDKSGKSASLASNFQINSNYAFIEDFVLENGFLIGNRIYSKSNSQTIILKPSRFIAFKKIYLDGDEIIDYEIKGNSNVIINLNFAKKNGILKFEFINNNYETFSQNFEYYTDLEKPILSLDYIYKDIMPMGDFYLISGNVNDSYFNKSSLTVNSKDNVFWYGDNFEAYLEVSSAGINNLRIFGKDMSGNFFDEQYGSILFGDNTFTNINSDSYPKKDFITLNFLSSDSSRNKNFIYSYDGFFQRGFYVKSASNNLASHDREGLRSLKLKSYESSGKSKLSDLLYSLDSSGPKIYYINFNNGFADFIIDGTLSEIDLDSIWAKSDGNLKTVNFCTDSYFKYDTCLRVSTSFGLNVEIFVKDMAGNEILKNFAINDNFNNITYDLKNGAQ
ncbi:hypothetical protein EOM09_06720, partial [bacterium]|nr:hypothetical protein [bacterium]